MSEPQQPEYGQTKQPEYGAMAGQYPGYDPYLYGRPESETQPANGDANAGQGQNPNGTPGTSANGGYGAYGAPGYGPNQGNYGQPGPYAGQPQNQPAPGQNGYPWPGQSGQPTQPGMPMQPGQPANGNQGRRFRYGIDVDDPNQNPLYGHWDLYAIMSLVFAIFFSAVPLLPALMGAMAMWRTRTFHMKGFGLALAAVIINVLTTLMTLWLMVNGMSAGDLMSQLTGGYGGSGDSGSTDDGSLTA